VVWTQYSGARSVVPYLENGKWAVLDRRGHLRKSSGRLRRVPASCGGREGSRVLRLKCHCKEQKH
jgi:hypothetical protein